MNVVKQSVRVAKVAGLSKTNVKKVRTAAKAIEKSAKAAQKTKAAKTAASAVGKAGKIIHPSSRSMLSNADHLKNTVTKAATAAKKLNPKKMFGTKKTVETVAKASKSHKTAKVIAATTAGYMAGRTMIKKMSRKPEDVIRNTEANVKEDA